MDAAQRERKLKDFGASSVATDSDQKVVKTGLSSSFLIERNFPLITADHATQQYSKLFRNMFPDS